jgi:hemolysin III
MPTYAVATVAAPQLKPLYRGSLHRWAFIVSFAAAATLIAVTAALVGAAAAWAVSVYSVTAIGLFGVSTLYHRRTWATPRAELIMRRLDHAMIFLLIAGSYTPLALFAMPRATGHIVLIVVWIGALVGIALRLIWPETRATIAVPIYLGLGWVVAFVLPEMLHQAGAAALVLVLVGCALYTIGGIFFAIQWPNPWPRTFGFHEFFHAATVLAATCHYIAIWLALF